MSGSTTQNSRADSEAAEWFTRLSRRSVRTQDLHDFRAWRREPANDTAFAKVERAWTVSGALVDDPDIRAATADALQRTAARKPVASRRAALGRILALGAGGLACAALGAGWIYVQGQMDLHTKVGEQRLVVLEDGSRVRLNTDSAIRVEFGGNERRIVLTRGEAFFEAAHDANRPFVVDAGPARVRALGTKFDIRRDTAAVRVTLVEGRVTVAHDDKPATAVLSPRQQLTVTAAGVSAPRPVDPVQQTGWTTGRLTFQHTALQDAVAEVNRYADRKIRIDPSLAQEPVSGVFDAGDTEAFVAAVQTLFDLKAAPGERGEIRLVREGSRGG